MAEPAPGGRPLYRPIVVKDGGADDLVRPFSIEGMEVRGRLVRLGAAVEEIIAAHAYEPPLSHLVAELVALVSLLGSLMKFDGVLTIQAKAEEGAPLRFLVADYHAPGHVRAYVEKSAGHEGPLDAEAGLSTLMGAGGYLAMTIDQGSDMERYQGIVALEGDRLADCAMSWFRQSEQTPTALRLSAGRDPVSGHWRAGGVMVQHLARGEDGGPRLLDRNEAEHWRRASILMESVRDTELLDPALDADQLLYRLYHEDGVRVYEPIPLAHRCRCSRKRLTSVLKSFGPDDLAAMLRDGRVEATCQFCSRLYLFHPEEIGLDIDAH